MAEKSKKPAIRFAGFTEAWEQRKLGDICDVRDGTHDSPRYVNSGHPFITSKNIKEGFINYEDVQYISDDDFNEINKRSKVSVNDILMGMIGTIGNIALIREVPDFAIKNVALIKDINKVSCHYLYHALQSKGVTNQLSENLDGGTQKFIALNKIRELAIPFTCKSEQNKIGAYMDNIDNLITLHQRKYDKLVNVKKAMLEKMFPKDGADVPEIRFKGFTEAWEQRKLGDETIEMLAGGDIDKDKVVENGEYPIYANALVNDGIVGYYDDYYRVKAPAVSVTGRGDVGHAQARMTDFTPVVRLLAIRSDHDCYFLENAINTQRIIIESTGVPQLTVPQLSSYDIFFPRKLEEEQKIGVYFHSIDNLITLHQRKLEKLKNLKKACLEKMFV